MKKWINVLLFAALVAGVVSLASCKKTTDPEEDDDVVKTEKTALLLEAAGGINYQSLGAKEDLEAYPADAVLVLTVTNNHATDARTSGWQIGVFSNGTDEADMYGTRVDFGTINGDDALLAGATVGLEFALADVLADMTLDFLAINLYNDCVATKAEVVYME